MNRPKKPSVWGLLAEFDSPDSLIHATWATRNAGYTEFDAYSPAPLEELSEAVTLRQPWVPRIVLIAGLSGAGLAFLLQWWISAIDYPVNVGGRALFSWPAFVPVTFELGVLCGAFGALIGMLALNGLPAPYHPAFHVPAFRSVTKNGFFLAIESRDGQFDLGETSKFLQDLSATEVHIVAW